MRRRPPKARGAARAPGDPHESQRPEEAEAAPAHTAYDAGVSESHGPPQPQAEAHGAHPSAGTRFRIVAPGAPPTDDGSFAIGQTYRFASDYILQGQSDQCGPTYKTQTEPTTCEWFIHDFANGIPQGRYDLWAVWEAPCQAWADIGFTDTCTNPTEITSLFSSGVNSPFDNGDPSFTEHNQAREQR